MSFRRCTRRTPFSRSDQEYQDRSTSWSRSQTFAEIAACLGISPNTAASRYRYALEKLRTAMQE